MEDDFEDVSEPDMIIDGTWVDPLTEIDNDQDYFMEDLNIVIW